MLRSAGGLYAVDLGEQIIDCTVRGRLKLGDARVTAGDRVIVEILPQGNGRIDRLLPRTTRLSRRAAAGGREQVIVANADQLAAVFAAAQPAPDLRLLDRFLVLGELGGLAPFIVLNKLDLAADGDLGDALAPYLRAGYEILLTSARRGDGVLELGRRLRDHATVFAGPSGVGKSSLLNRLLPDEELRVREVSQKRGRGKHTTVRSSFYRLPSGGYVADTPGLQQLVLWGVSPDELAGAFPEFRGALQGCRFNDCRHVAEPDCAIRQLVRSGVASEGRYGSYVALLKETGEGS